MWLKPDTRARKAHFYTGTEVASIMQYLSDYPHTKRGFPIDRNTKKNHIFNTQRTYLYFFRISSRIKKYMKRS